MTSSSEPNRVQAPAPGRQRSRSGMRLVAAKPTAISRSATPIYGDTEDMAVMKKTDDMRAASRAGRRSSRRPARSRNLGDDQTTAQRKAARISPGRTESANNFSTSSTSPRFAAPQASRRESTTPRRSAHRKSASGDLLATRIFSQPAQEKGRQSPLQRRPL